MAEKHAYQLEINTIYGDLIGAALCFTVCTFLLTFLRKIYDKGLIDVFLYGKLNHIIIGLIVMLFWPMLSCSVWGRVAGGFIPSFFMRRAIVSCFGRPTVNNYVKTFRNKYRDSRVLLKAAVSYGVANAFATIVHVTRTNIAIAVVCNLCAGDGVADIVGRRLGRWKLPYNKNKSYAGSISMAIIGFFASIIFRYYFSWWGYIQDSPNMVLGFLTVSIASALVESHPLSSTIEDNLTVPIASIFVGIFVL